MKRPGVVKIAFATSLLVTLSTTFTSAATIMGVEYPDIEIFDEKRSAGQPFLHEHPSKLLGMN